MIGVHVFVFVCSIACGGSHMFHSCLFQEPFMERLGVNSELHQFIAGLPTDKEVSVSIVLSLSVYVC